MENNMVNQIEKRLISDLINALNKAKKQGELLLDVIPEIMVEIPRYKSHGDYATNLAMVLAGQAKMVPYKIAEIIVNNFSSEIVEKVEIAGPGFINFTLDKQWLYDALHLVMKLGEDYGKIDFGQNKRLQIEFISANPTGPLHVGHSRGAVVGDVLANILEAAGYQVEKEYYINDAGNQMDILGNSTLIRYQQACGQDVKLPEDSYAGEYLKDIAREIRGELGEELLNRPRAEQLQVCREYAYEKLLAQIKEDLLSFGIEFDLWFSERELHRDGKIEEAIKKLQDKGYIYEKDDALWFKSTEFRDDKDRVIIKSDGVPTYLAADIAYHLNKLERGYDSLINIWGADHHGYIPRIKAVIEAFGYDRDKLDVIIVQMVTLLRNGKQVPMSKRSGNFVTMRDVIDEVGKDAARYFYIMRSADSHFDFDLDLAKEQSTNNPVYYIQYAHARIHSILDKVNFEIKEGADLSLLDSDEEVDLMKLLARYPEEIRLSAEKKQPHPMAGFAYDLANAFHIFYNQCRVITDDQELTAARLFLVKATKQVLKNVLSLLGISAPDHM